jgi:hypothetical protein
MEGTYMAATVLTFSMIDHSGEKSRTKVYLEELAGNGSNYDDILTSEGVLRTALYLTTDMAEVGSEITIPIHVGDGTPPSAEIAQREIAIRVKYRDTVNGRYGHFTVPGPKTGFYPPTGNDVVPLDNVIFEAFITVLEANIISRDKNPISIVEGRLIGRSN